MLVYGAWNPYCIWEVKWWPMRWVIAGMRKQHLATIAPQWCRKIPFYGWTVGALKWMNAQHSKAFYVTVSLKEFCCHCNYMMVDVVVTSSSYVVFFWWWTRKSVILLAKYYCCQDMPFFIFVQPSCFSQLISDQTRSPKWSSKSACPRLLEWPYLSPFTKLTVSRQWLVILSQQNY